MCSNMTLPQRNLTLNAASHSSIASHASLGNTSSSDSSPSVAVAATADPTVTSNIASNQTISLSLRRSQLEVPSSNTSGGCYTAPFVRCNESDPWTPLWNLHVHSKQTEKFRSVRCQCWHYTILIKIVLANFETRRDGNISNEQFIYFPHIVSSIIFQQFFSKISTYESAVITLPKQLIYVSTLVGFVSTQWVTSSYLVLSHFIRLTLIRRK